MAADEVYLDGVRFEEHGCEGLHQWVHACPGGPLLDYQEEPSGGGLAVVVLDGRVAGRHACGSRQEAEEFFARWVGRR